jgi:transcriptional regulator with XRE-family HTH domain
MGKLPRRQYRNIYLDEWLAATGRDRAGAAVAGGVDQSYLANMVAGRKMNPSAHVLLAISEYLGITVNDLYRPPPPESLVSRFGDISPAARDALIRTVKPKS